jgi:hypothetical protein
VGFKHLYLSKTVVHQPNFAFRKPPLGQDKKGYRKICMVWLPVYNRQQTVGYDRQRKAKKKGQQLQHARV